MRAVLDRFPGAEIVAVRDVAAEEVAAPMPEDKERMSMCATSLAFPPYGGGTGEARGRGSDTRSSPSGFAELDTSPRIRAGNDTDG